MKFRRNIYVNVQLIKNDLLIDAIYLHANNTENRAKPFQEKEKSHESTFRMIVIKTKHSNNKYFSWQSFCFIEMKYWNTHKYIVYFSRFTIKLGKLMSSSIQNIGNTRVGIVFTISIESIVFISILNCNRLAAVRGEPDICTLQRKKKKFDWLRFIIDSI